MLFLIIQPFCSVPLPVSSFHLAASVITASIPFLTAIYANSLFTLHYGCVLFVIIFSIYHLICLFEGQEIWWRRSLFYFRCHLHLSQFDGIEKRCELWNLNIYKYIISRWPIFRFKWMNEMLKRIPHLGV